MLRIHTVLITLLITALAACGTNPGSTGTGSDAGTEDGRSGHGETGLDASADVAMDDGSDAPADTATDAPADTPSDAGGDAPIDMGSDALIDTGGDAPIDTGGDAPGDAGGDAPIDTGGDAPGDTGPPVEGLTYAIVDTGQDRCFGLEVEEACEGLIDARFGQDAQYHGNPFDLVDNGDGTLTDHVTGLMWQQDPGAKMTWDEAAAAAASFRLGGYDDWRLPTIEELYSLIDFNGRDPSGYEGSSTDGMRPFISDLFVFAYGDTGAGERLIDAQFATTTFYVGGGLDDDMMFGVNFADGRIKGYGTGPLPGRPGDKEFFVLYVRGDAYGINDFADNGDGTITDAASGLMWQRGDSVDGLDWPEALGWCEDLELAGHDDWRLPNVKELHSLVDYTRSPSTTSSAAIDPMFEATGITNEGGAADFAAYWSSTTHVSWRDGHEGASGAYVNFGRSMGYMDGAWRDVHGAGAQRGDPRRATRPTGRPATVPRATRSASTTTSAAFGSALPSKAWCLRPPAGTRTAMPSRPTRVPPTAAAVATSRSAAMISVAPARTPRAPTTAAVAASSRPATRSSREGPAAATTSAAAPRPSTTARSIVTTTVAATARSRALKRPTATSPAPARTARRWVAPAPRHRAMAACASPSASPTTTARRRQTSHSAAAPAASACRRSRGGDGRPLPAGRRLLLGARDRQTAAPPSACRWQAPPHEWGGAVFPTLAVDTQPSPTRGGQRRVATQGGEPQSTAAVTSARV